VKVAVPLDLLAVAQRLALPLERPATLAPFTAAALVEQLQPAQPVLQALLDNRVPLELRSFIKKKIWKQN
jgi:hypothetical protein